MNLLQYSRCRSIITSKIRTRKPSLSFFTDPPTNNDHESPLRPINHNNMILRTYRGDSSDMKHRSEVSTNPQQDAILQREEALLKVAAPKYERILERHIRMPRLEEIPRASLPLEFQESGANFSKEELELEVRKKRLVYRSKQRGWLEVDVLLGTWANQNVPHLSMEELDEFEKFVNMETIDIYNVITLRTDVPQDMKSENGNESVVERIQAWARSSPLGRGDPEKYSTVKRQHNLI